MPYSFHDPPVFSDEGRAVQLDGNTKGHLTEDTTDGETVFVWSQDPFYYFDGFSMSKRLVNVITKEAERVYVLSTNEDSMFEYRAAVFTSEEATVIPPDHEVFNAVKPEKQVVVPLDSGTQFNLPDNISWLE